MTELGFAVVAAWVLVALAAAGRRRGYRQSKAEAQVSRAWVEGFRAGVRAAREDLDVERLRSELRFEGFDR